MVTPLIDCEWRSVVGYEGIYLVSDTGLVYSEPRTELVNSKRTGGHYRYRNSNLIKPRLSNTGYLQVGLYLDGKCKCINVHRLVATAFIPNIHSLKEVNHIDGDRQNNRVSNLEWCSRKENALHSTSILGKNIGENNKKAILSNDQVLYIWGLLRRGFTQTEIGKLMNVSNHVIHKIAKGDNWSWLTGAKKERVK